ncbi:HipA domain-containing protein [Ramlibacter sp. WS9]|uniref:HipA domain-containing protein n=1 Tax=Ramlibacter sp. WS9 TaxID=1882741 RepID=UPI001141641F|nr:HipA domain-containing protein [Ramlibacter sp. WS9]ROZ66238.1 type II toxin-antitoxin system HipA family toxin [Ramlibacter sp. WS9]
MRSLHVWIDQRRIGTLQEGNNLWAIEYDPQWAQATDSFDLSPALARSELRHEDGGTARPVQWYFDNLLPEELLREALAREAGIRDAMDAFALLEYLGAESAGSLTLLPPDMPPPARGGMQPLPPDALNDRIRNLPRATLASGAPKRMSLAGAQHKLLVNYLGGELYEPEGATPSTHILKPDHQKPDMYPASVFNEYLTMRLAAALRLDVPQVWMMYVPEPVYIVERFDRHRDGGAKNMHVKRMHIIDACQLLNRDRLFKHTGASLAALRDIIAACTNRAAARLRLFSWLVFNILVANDDCHLKNLSFRVGADGVFLAPHYDLLSTGAYYTRAVADANATWPTVPMAIELPGAKTFGQVSLKSVLEAGAELGVPERPARRIVEQMAKNLLPATEAVLKDVEGIRARAPSEAAAALGNQSYLANVLQKVVYPEMVARLKG